MASKPGYSALLLAAILVLAGPSAAAASAPQAGAAHEASPRGTLLLIGGALEDSNRPVYQRFLALASAHGPAHIVIAAAASLEQDESADYKIKALKGWAPGVSIEVVRRETPTAETVAAIDRATAMFFTGGDQKRVTDRYRPRDADTPEWLAMRRLLARGGVIAGTSAGDAMMGNIMFLGGGSRTALGIVPTPRRLAPGEKPDDIDEDADEDNPAWLGPRLAPGMRFYPLGICDSHFFERDRVGRLVAAQEAAGVELGIGVGEDAAVEVDLRTGELRGISLAESLLVDTGELRRDGLSRTGLVGRLIHQGDRIAPARWIATATAARKIRSGPVQELPGSGPGADPRPAAWRLFHLASEPVSHAVRQSLDGYSITAYPAGRGNVAFEIRANH